MIGRGRGLAFATCSFRDLQGRFQRSRVLVKCWPGEG